MSIYMEHDPLVPMTGNPSCPPHSNLRGLTYNPGSVPERRVASGAIGSDYYTWRYGLSDSMRYGPPPIVVPTPPIASNGQAPTPTATMSGG